MIKLTSIFTSFIIFLSINVSASEPYRILITNDDGINDPGLKALVEALHDDAEIIVAAPAIKWSGKGHGSALWDGPIKIETVQIEGSLASYSVHAMPADAARFGILMAKKLGKKLDLVISGINSGDNVGSAAHLSGTVGAAMEAQYYDIPSIAVSLDGDAAHDNLYGDAAAFINTLVPEIQKNGLPKGTILNVNVPASIKGIKVVPMGDYVVEITDFEITEDGIFKPEIIYPDGTTPGTDAYEFAQGYITITPLKLDNTNTDALKGLKDWDFKAKE